MGASASKHKSHGSKRDVNRIPDRPSPPGKPQLVPGTPHSEPDVVTIKWDPPEYDGGAKVTGYLVEHRRTGSPHWVRASPTLVRLPELTLSGLEPGWRYQFRVSAKNSIGYSEPGELSELLTVTLQRTAASAPHFTKELSDIVALENEKAELTVEYRGTPAPTVAWYKDGLEIFSGRRHRILTENGSSTLIIHQTALSDEGEIKCTTTNRVGHAVTKAILHTEAPPSIRLQRQYEEGLLFEKDEVIRLKVTVAGRPVPSVNWMHNGEPLSNTGRYEMVFTDRHATLRVDEARRSDRGEYQVRAVNKLGEDIASFLVTVTDRPQAPGKAKVVMTLGRSVTLSWTAPDDDGGCKIGNYIVEYYRLGWNMWLKAATCRQLTTTLGDLIEGSEYKFRVKAENPYGVSDAGEESDILFIPDPHRGLLTPPERSEGKRGSDEIAIEEWLLDPHKRQRERTPGGSPSRDHKKVKKKQELEEKSSEKQINPETTLTHEDNGFHPNLKTKDKYIGKEPQDAPIVPKRRLKRKQLELKGNEDEEEIISQKIKVIDEGKTEEKTNKLRQQKSEEITSSSELMLVLLPNSRATTEERESTRKEIIDSLKDDSPGVPPPMSLSAPELGSIEPERTMLRPWVSSTELLHERAMARFYQAAAEEEAEKSLRRRFSIERRSSFHNRELPREFIRKKSMTGSDETLQQKAKNRLSLPEEILYKNVEITERSSQSINEEESEKRFYDILTKYGIKDEVVTTELKSRKGLIQPQSSEEEEMKSIQDTEEDINRVSETEEESMEESEEEYEMEEEEEYEEEEEIEEEETEEEEEEEIDDVDMLGESEGEFDERPSYHLDEETYHPRNMTPKTGTVSTIISSPPEMPEKKPMKNITDNLKMVTDVATAVVSHSIHIPIKSTLKVPEMPNPTVRIEVTPPPSDNVKVSVQVTTKDRYKPEQLNEPKKQHIIKPIIKKSLSPNRENSPTSVQFKLQEDQQLTDEKVMKKRYSPPRFTPDGRHLPNLNPPIPKPILKIRDNSQERTINDDNKSNNLKLNVAPLAAVEPELNIVTKNEAIDIKNTDNENNVTDSVKLKKKQVRIEEPENTKKPYDIDDNDNIGITAAGDFARNRRRPSRTPLIDSSDPTKCLIHHYSDIVREFGRIRKAPTTLYLNYEDLKAAAQKSGENLIEPKLETEKNNETDEIESQQNFQKIENKEKINDTTTISNIKKENEKNEKEEILDDSEIEEDKELEFLMESPIKDLPQLVLLSEVVTKEENEIVEQNHLSKLAERKVRTYLDYMTDLAMFITACWLYAFNDERLAIPILILMVYRQVKEATVSFFKRQAAKLPKLPKLPWKKNQ